MNKDILLYFALLMWFVVPVSAQPTIFISKDTVETGTSVLVDFKVKDFVDIQSMQFSVNWDPSVLQFDIVANLGALPDYAPTSFGTFSADLGKLTTLWLDNQLLGVTLDDNTVIFSLVFTVTGEPDSFSDVSITGDPTAIEFSDFDGNVLPVIIENGMIIVFSTSSSSPNDLSYLNGSNELFTLFQNEPNPFGNQSVIRFDLKSSSEVEFSVQSVDGRLIYAIINYFQEGENSIVLDADKLHGPGTYLYTIKINEYFKTRKMVLIR